VGDLGADDGFVVGSAAYMGHWMKDAVAFVKGQQHLLAQRPVWLFTSGPLGTEATNAKGEDLRVAAEPKELPEFEETIHPREHRVFFGALDPGELSFTERSLRKLPAARAILPEGDFRDWDEIQVWAQGIAEQMTQMDTAGNGGKGNGERQQAGEILEHSLHYLSRASRRKRRPRSPATRMRVIQSIAMAVTS
jgi:menaquinone-dependent protoporphyrinogen oxidase